MHYCGNLGFSGSLESKVTIRKCYTLAPQKQPQSVRLNLVCSDSQVVPKRKADLPFKVAAKKGKIILVDERKEMSLYQGKFRLDFRKTFLMVEMVKHCNRFSGDDVDLQKWKSLKTDEKKSMRQDITEANPSMAQDKLDDPLNLFQTFFIYNCRFYCMALNTLHFACSTTLQKQGLYLSLNKSVTTAVYQFQMWLIKKK